MREVLAGMQTENNTQSQANLLSTLFGNLASPFANILQAMAPKPAGDGEDQYAMASDDAKTAKVGGVRNSSCSSRSSRRRRLASRQT
eukprot:1119134-Pleurochrysis_carterae.AAC.1